MSAASSNTTTDKNRLIAAVAGGVVAGGILAMGLVHLLPVPAFCHHPKPRKGEITTHYWNGRGLMEIPRQMLAAAGVSFADGKHSKFTGDDKANLGRMPTVEAADGSVGQSRAINFYIASRCNLLGDNAFEAAKCLEIQEHVKETIDTYQKIVPWGTEPTDEQTKQWFEEGAAETEGVAQGRGTRYLTWFLGRIEAGLTGTNGFAVGNRLSLADFCLYSLLAEHLEESETDKPEDARYPFHSKALTQAAIAKYPKIATSIAKVAGNAGVQKHLESRGPQGF